MIAKPTTVVALAAVLLAAACAGDGDEPPASPSPAPTIEASATAPPQIEGDCYESVPAEAQRRFGPDANGPFQTERYQAFVDNVGLVLLVAGEGAAALGSRHEELFEELLGEPAFVSERRREAWNFILDAFVVCRTEGTPEPEAIAHPGTVCASRGVAGAWTRYGDAAFAYAPAVESLFAARAADTGTPPSPGEAWTIAQQYADETSGSPFANQEAIDLALATLRECLQQ